MTPYHPDSLIFLTSQAAAKASFEKYSKAEERRRAARRVKKEQAKTAAEEALGQGSLFTSEDLSPVDMMLDNFVGAFK